MEFMVNGAEVDVYAMPSVRMGAQVQLNGAPQIEEINFTSQSS